MACPAAPFTILSMADTRIRRLLRVSICRDTSQKLEYLIYFKSAQLPSGSTRTKAKSIYKGNTKKGLITATQSSTSADWYKIKINSSQKVNLEVITKTGGYNGGIRISVFRSGKTKAFGSSDFYWDDPASTLQLYTSGYGGRLSKGTYYIKVQKYGCGSGYYQIKWK